MGWTLVNTNCTKWRGYHSPGISGFRRIVKSSQIDQAYRYEKLCLLVDVASSADKKSLKNLRNYVTTKKVEIETSWMWHLKTTTLFVVIGALEMISKGANKFLAALKYLHCKKIILIGTFHILRRFLSTQWPQIIFFWLHDTSSVCICSLQQTFKVWLRLGAKSYYTRQRQIMILITQIWKFKTIIYVVIGGLCMVKKRPENYVSKIHSHISISKLQMLLCVDLYMPSAKPSPSKRNKNIYLT